MLFCHFLQRETTFKISCLLPLSKKPFSNEVCCKRKEFARVATVREKYLENKIFLQVREKSGNFVDGQGSLERTWKVREKSGNLKINGYVRQSLENLFILFKRGKDVDSHEIV